MVPALQALLKAMVCLLLVTFAGEAQAGKARGRKPSRSKPSLRVSRRAFMGATGAMALSRRVSASEGHKGLTHFFGEKGAKLVSRHLDSKKSSKLVSSLEKSSKTKTATMLKTAVDALVGAEEIVGTVEMKEALNLLSSELLSSSSEILDGKAAYKTRTIKGSQFGPLTEEIVEVGPIFFVVTKNRRLSLISLRKPGMSPLTIRLSKQKNGVTLARSLDENNMSERIEFAPRARDGLILRRDRTYEVAENQERPHAVTEESYWVDDTGEIVPQFDLEIVELGAKPRPNAGKPTLLKRVSRKDLRTNALRETIVRVGD